MIRCYSFKKEEVKIKTFENTEFGKTLVWTDVNKPSKEDKKKIVDKFKLSFADISNSLDPKERARIENNEHYSLIILKVPTTDNKHTGIGSIGIFIGRNFLVSISDEKIGVLQDLHNEIDKQLLRKKGYQYLLSQIIFKIERNYFNILNELSIGVDKLENKIIQGSTIYPKQIFGFKKPLLYLRKALVTNREALLMLQKGEAKFVSKQVFSTNLFMENLQLIDMEELLRGRLTEIANMHLSTVSNNLNVTMKYFAVVAALFLVPMLINGSYGMNFRVLPLAQYQHGFWIMVGLMIFSMAFLYIIFKKKKWV